MSQLMYGVMGQWPRFLFLRMSGRVCFDKMIVKIPNRDVLRELQDVAVEKTISHEEIVVMWRKIVVPFLPVPFPASPLTCEGQKVPQSPKPRKIQSNEKVTKK